MSSGSDGRKWLQTQSKLTVTATRAMVGFGLVGVGAGVLQAWSVASLVGPVLVEAAPRNVAGWAALFVISAGARAGLAVVIEGLAFDAGAAARRRLRTGFMVSAFLAGPHRAPAAGESVATVVDQVDALDGFFGRWLPAATVAWAGPLIVLAAVFWADPVAAGIMAVGAAMVPVGMALAGLGAAAASQRQFVAMARLQSRFLDRVRGLATIVLAGHVETEAGRLQEAAEELSRRTMRVLRVAFLSSAVLDAAAAAVLIVLAIRAGVAWRAGMMHPITSVLGLILVSDLFAPLRSFSAAYQDRMQAHSAAPRLAGSSPVEPLSAPAVVRTVAASGVSVAFEAVRFSWSTARRPVLDGLSFRVPANETAVLVGPSGVGKSTVIELLLGLVRPDSGRITINGADLSTLTPQALSRMTAWIGQRPSLFAGSIRENIRFGHPDASDAAVQDAARAAGLEPVAAWLPEGLDTIIGEGGYGLSGGQAQRGGDRTGLHSEYAVAVAGRADGAPGFGNRDGCAGQSPAAGDWADGDPGSPFECRNGVRREADHAGCRACRARADRRVSALLRIGGLVRSEALWLAGGIITTLLSVMALTGLLLAAGTAPLAAGVVLLFALRGLGIARVVMRYLERLTTHKATFRALSAVRVWMFRAMAPRAAGGLGFLRRGDVLARAVGDVDALDGVYLRILVPAAAVVLLLLDVAVFVGGVAPALAVGVGALLTTAAFVIPWWAARGTLAEGTALAEARAGLRIAAVDALGGMREVRAFGNEGRVLAHMQAREAALFDVQRRVARRSAWAQAIGILFGQAALLLVVLGGLPAATLIPAVLLTVAAFEAASAMPKAGALLGHAEASAQRVLNTAEAVPDGPVEPTMPFTLPTKTSVTFENVRFAWPGRTAVLEDLSLNIPAGSRVAILGPSGAGKSTLAALLLKVAAPDAGRVLLGGVDLAGLDAAEVRGRIAWLSQATHVFADTVRANLALGRRPGAAPDDPALWNALFKAGLLDVIKQLPGGLDAFVGEGGEGLSGGELRRLALARALLSDAPILILDEPATGLDDAAERAFFATLNEAVEGRTLLLIVHRLLGVERLDRIWRLSGGRAISATG